MKTIVISPDYSLPNEIETVHAMLSAGLDYFHVRKPKLSLGALRDYLAEFDASVRDRLVLHLPPLSLRPFDRLMVKSSGIVENCSSSAQPFDRLRVTQEIDENEKDVILSLSKYFGGFHERDTEFTIQTDKRRSRSVHIAFDKLRVTNLGSNETNSVMLSLSKHEQKQYNYILLSPIFPSISKANYGQEPNLNELRKSIEQIPTDVYALGGINPSRIAACQEARFDGIVMLGHIWNAKTKIEQIERFIEMKELCQHVPTP